MQCRELGMTLDAARGGGLDPQAEAALRAHLEQCPACRELAGREDAWIDFLRQRLGGAGPECAALEARIRAALEGARPHPAARLLGSGWAPRLAMAAVLAVVVLVPLWWLAGGAPARAKAAVARHDAHLHAPAGTIPPCCTPLDLAPGQPLAAHLAEERVPDLAASGLRFLFAAYCTFGGDPVYALAYEGADGRFSLYIGERGTREFKLLRHETRDGVPQARHLVAPEEGRSTLALDVVLWLRSGRLFTWVGPEGASFEAARRRLQTAP